MIAAAGFVSALAALALSAACAAAPAGYDAAATTGDARFGAQLGAGAQWQSQLTPADAPGSPALAFGGGVRLGCAGVDLNGFLHSFDPAELLAEIRNSLLGGAQAAAANYLITLAYANPTISSVLDMMDKKYAARFAAFAQACDAQAARARGRSAAHGRSRSRATNALTRRARAARRPPRRIDAVRSCARSIRPRSRRRRQRRTSCAFTPTSMSRARSKRCWRCCPTNASPTAPTRSARRS